MDNANSATSVSYTTIVDGSSMDLRATHFGGVEPRFGKIYIMKAKVRVTDKMVESAIVVFDMKSFTVENFDDEASKVKLTRHLQNEGFFNVREYSSSTFELTKIESLDGKFNSSLTGNLTILDVTKSIAFMANVDISDDEMNIVSEDFAIDRRDWGIKYNVEGTEGVTVDYIVANEIGFTINVRISK
ncbi:MAG: polyisoprenoid-binding protein YceI [Polaribacter sp.]